MLIGPTAQIPVRISHFGIEPVRSVDFASQNYYDIREASGFKNVSLAVRFLYHCWYLFLKITLLPSEYLGGQGPQ